LNQQIRFCTTNDGIRIACATVGKGPPLVRAAHWLTHLQYDLDNPVYRHWVREFSKHHQYIRYDERGCGLSDWDVDLSFEAWVHDLETVVDSLGLEKFDLLGVSQGGAVSLAYSVRHPERVNHLVLYGAYARGWGNRNLSPAELEEQEAQITLMKLGWGKDNPSARQVFTSRFIPDATLEEIHAFNNLQKVSTSPENAVRFQSVFRTVNVLDLLPKVSVPTMILHLREDASVPFWVGRELATRIPNARFIALEGKDHILLEHDTAWNSFLHEVRDFLGVKETPADSPVPSELGLPGWLKGPRKK
jgi:pimeloyl-ACP methyl ester carboxylesterase